ncbi:MAG TPA: hypothetical protein VEK79_09795 [Thermoanaerobaculia bacterium]|nr:hypothetical protein [Thermoanaerobaculia bacterium]
MPIHDIHEPSPFFEYIRLEDESLPEARRDSIDVALLDMNHSWPNVGHDALVHVVLEASLALRDELERRAMKVRVLSFDVRRRNAIPPSPNGSFQLYIGTGGPGHLDPRLNDGTNEWSQGVAESDAWEAPLFRLFDEILTDRTAAMIAVCHSFGLVCRWSGAAVPILRDEKSSGMPLNRLSREALQHPWFAQFALELPDRQHFRVVDNRLFDLILESPGKSQPIAFEAGGSTALTMIELARDASGEMPRFLGVNHHPEIIDREHIMQVLDTKRAHGEVSDQWYDERAITMRDLFHGENERQSRLTSKFTLIEPVKFHLAKAIAQRE